MNKIISETETIAVSHFKNFGFNEDQVNALILQGKKDLHNELGKLEILLEIDSVEGINNSLHALKGLFSQLGNDNVAERLDAIGEDQGREARLKDVSKLLFDK